MGKTAVISRWDRRQGRREQPRPRRGAL